MRRNRRSTFNEPSLVPLADMLANTVGVMVFIFIFTVITAGGASMLKTLPLERSSDLKFVTVVCSGDRALPLDQVALIDEFMRPLGRPTPESLGQWLDQFLEHRLAGENADVSGEIGSSSLVFKIKPYLNRGETAAALKRSGSRFRTFLGGFDPKERFVHFLVYPDGLRAFKEARSIALENRFATGWMPLPADELIRFGSGGGGRTPTTE